MAKWLGTLAGGLCGALAVGERRKAVANLAIAFPDMSESRRREITWRCFRGLGRSAAEVCCLHKLDLTRYVTISETTRRLVDERLSEGRGLVWVTAHLGNWELLAAGLTAHGYDVRPVASPSYDSRFTSMIDRWRRGHHVRTLWRDRADVASEIGTALGEGAILGLLIDQDTRTRGAFVPFFGRSAWTPTGAAEIARSCRAPLVAGFIRRRASGGHVIEAEEISRSDVGDSRESDVQVTTLLTAAIEASVRRRPEDWVWMHRRWKTRPATEEAS